MRRAIPSILISTLAVLVPTALAQATPPDEDPGSPTKIEAKKEADADSPISDGELFRSVTPIEDSERNAVDKGYRWLIQRIAAGTADKRIMRQHYWLKSRLMPFDKPIPERWRERARQRLFESSAASVTASEAAMLPSVGRWIEAGPSTIPGRVTGLSRPGGTPGWILAAMADGGAWITRDAGASWEPLTDREATQASGSVLGDPLDTRVLYWGTGEGNGAIDNYGGIGLLRSADGGRTWSASNGFSGTIRCLAMDASAQDSLWACGNDGLYRSTDRGAVFTKVAGLPANGASSVAIRPDRPSTIFAGLWGGGVWRSEDGGATWAQLAGGLPANLGRVDLSLCRANPDVVVAGGELNGGELWKSTDSGNTWTQQTAANGLCGGQCWYDLTVAVAPDDCDTIYFGGVGAYVSRNGGQTFAQMPTSGSGSAGWDFHAILAGPGGEVVLGADAGVFRSTDWGATFAPRSTNLPTTQYYGGCGHDTDPVWIAGGTQDNGTDQVRTGEAWRYVLGGDGGKCALSGNRVLAEYQVTNVQRSIDGGQSFGDANGGIGRNDRKGWVGIFTKDPSDAQTIYLGTNKVYRTTDFHDTAWVMILGPAYFSRLVSALAVSPVDRNVLWAGFEFGGLYRTASALAPTPSFQSVKGPIPNRTIARVTPHPTDANGAWVVVAGYGYPKIYRTQDAGASYADVTGDFPDVPITDLEVDPGDANVLIAGTDLGVFRSVDGGAHWSGFSDGLPLAAVADLFRHPASGDLVIATHGRSFYRYRPASSGATAVPDGRAVPGREMRAERTSAGALWLSWDTVSCTAAEYNLFWGPLDQVAAGTYAGAVCHLGRSGETVVPMPGAPEQSLYFVVAAASAGGVEGPHAFRSDGTPSPATGVGQCGVTSHEVTASCP